MSKKFTVIGGTDKPAAEGGTIETFVPAKKGYETERADHEAISKTKEWIAKKLFAKGECSRWIAPPKMMKSALLASATNHLARGVDWFGFKVRRPVGCLYIALERADLTIRRLVAEQKHKEWKQPLPIRICRKRITLATPADAQKLVDTLKETGDELGVPIEFTVFDTSAKLVAAHGGDEQQAKDNALVYGLLAEVREKTGVHTAVIGHLGKDKTKGERGSNATLGDADLVVAIDGDEIKTATITDANDMSAGDIMSFKAREYIFGYDEDGDKDAVHIVDPEIAPKAAKSESVRLTKDENTFFRLLYDAGSHGLTLNDWNKQAMEVGLGEKRRADLTDLRNKLMDKKAVREFAGRWRVNHS
jgi:AAA domain